MMTNDDFNERYEQEAKKCFNIKLYPFQEEHMVEWVAEIAELPGCIGVGDTPEEALVALEDAKKAWIEIALLDGKVIPDPINKSNLDYSGKFTLRLPKSLHRELSEAATEEDISLNQYLLHLITKKHYEKQVKRVAISFTAEIKRAPETFPALFDQPERWIQNYCEYDGIEARRGFRVQ